MKESLKTAFMTYLKNPIVILPYVLIVILPVIIFNLAFFSKINTDIISLFLGEIPYSVYQISLVNPIGYYMIVLFSSLSSSIIIAFFESFGLILCFNKLKKKKGFITSLKKAPKYWLRIYLVILFLALLNAVINIPAFFVDLNIVTITFLTFYSLSLLLIINYFFIMSKTIIINDDSGFIDSLKKSVGFAKNNPKGIIIIIVILTGFTLLSSFLRLINPYLDVSIGAVFLLPWSSLLLFSYYRRKNEL